MSNSLDTISAATLQYTPTALAAIGAIENAGVAMPGDTKLQLAANIVLASAQGVSAVPIPKVQEVSALVSLLVGILNATGVFKHGPKVTAKA